jgi:hypothetical protein
MFQAPVDRQPVMVRRSVRSSTDRGGVGDPHSAVPRSTEHRRLHGGAANAEKRGCVVTAPQPVENIPHFCRCAAQLVGDQSRCQPRIFAINRKDGEGVGGEPTARLSPGCPALPLLLDPVTGIRRKSLEQSSFGVSLVVLVAVETDLRNNRQY